VTLELTDVAQDVFRVLESGDPILAGQTADANFRNREAAVAPAACSRPGPAGLLASSAWMRFAFTDLRFPVIDVARQDDRVWLRLRMQGRHTGAFVQFRDGRYAQAVPPTGRNIDFEQIHVLDLRDGLVVGHEAVRDDVTMLGQLGVFPPSPAVGLRIAAWKLSGRARRAAAEVSHAAEEAASHSLR
jgi:predicted ester cyclase